LCPFVYCIIYYNNDAHKYGELMELMTLMAGFGLSAAAGSRAWLVAFGLGVFHYTEYFSLSSEFAWLASPPVMAVLGVLVITEFVLDMYPHIGEALFGSFSTLSSFVVGGFALASMVGSLDGNLILLLGSGLLGSVTGLGIRVIRNEIVSIFTDVAEAGEEVVGETTVNTGRAVTESSVTGAVIGGAFLAPAIVGSISLVAIIAMVFWYLKKRRNNQP
jgi:hypothetical protein